MHPGVDGHSGPPCLNIHCKGIIGPRDFKLFIVESAHGASNSMD